ncbi:hypothetical protein DL98DRAFT_596710 [Cadophora sp. DSE1049]|nr:hypothetical protein DL98DRAFT_596710 [Cadophora sp. DSE1049]
MALIRASEMYNPIREWKVEEDVSDQRSITSRLCIECSKAYGAAVKHLATRKDVPKSTYRTLERSWSSLILWSDGYGVTDGELDEVLAKSCTLRQSTLELLTNISKTLTERLIPQFEPSDGKLDLNPLKLVTQEAASNLHLGYEDGDFEGSDSDSYSVTESDELDEIAEDLETDTQCLMDLDALIKAPAPDPVKETLPDRQETSEWSPHQLYCEGIINRFPKAKQDLVNRLALANFERFLRNKSDREKNMREDRQEEASGGTRFNDSGLGTSLQTGSHYAETVMTAMSYREGGGHSVRIPPLSADAKKNKPFDCIACGRKLQMTQNSVWKKHLYLDLRPWVCHDLSCNYSSPFANREHWIQHLGLAHGLDPEWSGFECPLCHQQTGNGRFVISHHLSVHMEEISLAALPSGPDSESGSESEISSGEEVVPDVEAEASQIDALEAQFRQNNPNLTVAQSCQMVAEHQAMIGAAKAKSLSVMRDAAVAQIQMASNRAMGKLMKDAI